MKAEELGSRAYEHVRVLSQAPRGAVTDGERQAQDYAAEIMHAVCDTVERRAMTGIPAPLSFNWLIVTGLVGLLVATWYFADAPWVLLLYTLMFFFLPRAVLAVRARAAQGSPRTSDNVIGRLTPAGATDGEGRATAIICAHLDSARASKLTGAVWSRLHRFLQDTWLQMVLILTTVAALRWVDSYVGLVPAAVWNIVGALAFGYSLFLTSVELVYIIIGRSKDYSPGANDNASGCGVVLALAEAFGSDRPRHLALDFILFTAEELGLIGSERYVKETKPDKKRTFVFNLDMVGTGDLFYAKGSGLLPRRTSGRLNDLLTAAATPVRGRWELMGNSDSFSFVKKGVPSCWLKARGGVSELVYHTLGDTVEHVEPATLGRAAEAVWQAVRALDAQVGEETTS
jgi:hypothetical protein